MVLSATEVLMEVELDAASKESIVVVSIVQICNDKGSVGREKRCAASQSLNPLQPINAIMGTRVMAKH